jgi:hypothetical protein
MAQTARAALAEAVVPVRLGLLLWLARVALAVLGERQRLQVRLLLMLAAVVVVVLPLAVLVVLVAVALVALRLVQTGPRILAVVAVVLGPVANRVTVVPAL